MVTFALVEDRIYEMIEGPTMDQLLQALKEAHEGRLISFTLNGPFERKEGENSVIIEKGQKRQHTRVVGMKPVRPPDGKNWRLLLEEMGNDRLFIARFSTSDRKGTLAIGEDF